MILDPLASDSFQEDPFREDPFLEVPFLGGPCLADPFLVALALVRHLLADPFQAQDPYLAEAPLDPFPADHSVVMRSWDQKEVCQMAGHHVVQVVRVSSLAAVDLACPVVDHALESLVLLGLQDHRGLLVQDLVHQDLVHETLEEVLC